MFVTVVLLCLFCLTKGDLVQYKCGEVGDKFMEFTPVLSVPGRYMMKLCTLRNPNITNWHIELWYFEGTTCNKTRRKFTLHSLVHETINNPTNCSNVCYSLDFDLIFAGCYVIHSEFKTAQKTFRASDNLFPVQNNLTIDIYKNSKPKVINIPNDKDVSLRWILNVPVPYYHSVIVKKKQTNTDEYVDYLVPAPGSCKLSNIYQVWCDLVLPAGCYSAHLRLEPPWYPLLNSQTDIRHEFCLNAARPPVLAAGGARGLWWALGGALLAAAALLLALALRHALRSRDYHKRVIAAWVQARESDPARVVVDEPSDYNILMLYAREGEQGQRAIDALKQLLQQAFSGQVLDIYAAQVTALAAPAPGAWLRGALQRPRTKVLLLQSPALLHLYCTSLTGANMHLREPLLGRGALYRRPHFGDQLLQLALRLVAEDVAAHHLYHKYYLATYEGLSGEILPQLVPYRRYLLPRAAPALLRDLAPSPSPDTSASHSPPPSPSQLDTDHLLEHYHTAVDEFVAHIHDNPDYLQDELVTV